MLILDSFIDIHSDAINRLNKNFVSLNTKDKIESIFFFVKDKIYYENSKDIYKASETLVFNKGNNFNKNILLYSLLVSNNINCEIRYFFLKDNSNKLFFRKDTLVPWFYVQILDKDNTLALDCTFDKKTMNFLNIRYKGDSQNYLPYDFFINNSNIFKVLKKSYPLLDLNKFKNYFNFKNFNCIKKEICYV